MTFTLNCWVRSQNVKQTFRVKIAKTSVVYDLQQAIKNEDPVDFCEVPAHALDLYKPKNPLSKKNLGAFILAEHGERLCGPEKLSEAFPEPPVGHDDIQVIVDAPLTVVCWLRGTALDDWFPIPFLPGESIYQLVPRIKDAQPELRNVANHLIRLYRISGNENELQECLDKLDDGQLLRHIALARNFLDVPVLEPLRVVVEAPTTEGTHCKRDDETPRGVKLLRALIARGDPTFLALPSEFQKITGPGRVIACNRPYEYGMIPHSLLHEAFGILKDRSEAAPSKRAIALLDELASDSRERYDDESGLRWNIRPAKLKHHFDKQFYTDKVPNTDCTTDGNFLVNVMPAAIRKSVSESEDALNEAILYYCHFLSEALKDDHHFYNFDTRFPCILMIEMGPIMAFYGAAWDGERANVLPLVQGLHLATNPWYEEDWNRFASCFDAFIAATESIEAHYRFIMAKAKANKTNPIYDPDIQRARRFPFLTSYCNDDGTETSFTYRERLVEESLLFSATVDQPGPGSGDCFVKFTRKYSEAAHSYLASRGMAPSIRKCIRMAGGWIAVVTDKSAYEALSELPLSEAEREKVKRKVTTIVNTLHEGGFVHGDVQGENLLVDRRSLASGDVTVHLINFDCAGRVGEVRYPVRMNHETVRRPEGVQAHELVKKEHDDEMVSFLFE